jgi:exodeoxyribonuclease VII small subunit
MTTTTEHTTYEDGIKELEEIISALENGGLGVTETVAKCRRGKALEKALREHLESCEGELKEIEQNKNLPEIKILAGGDEAERDPLADIGDFVDEPTAGAADTAPAGAAEPPSGPAAEDDIPF